MSGTQHCVSGVPRWPLLSLISLRQIASSSGGRTEYWRPHARTDRGFFKDAVSISLSAFRVPRLFKKPLSARALLRCDFALRSESAGCSCARFPAGLRLGAGLLASRHSQSHFKYKDKPKLLKANERKFLRTLWNQKNMDT